jgi:hypothetical protein
MAGGAEPLGQADVLRPRSDTLPGAPARASSVDSSPRKWTLGRIALRP